MHSSRMYCLLQLLSRGLSTSGSGDVHPMQTPPLGRSFLGRTPPEDTPLDRHPLGRSFVAGPLGRHSPLPRHPPGKHPLGRQTSKTPLGKNTSLKQTPLGRHPCTIACWDAYHCLPQSNACWNTLTPSAPPPPHEQNHT